MVSITGTSRTKGTWNAGPQGRWGLVAILCRVLREGLTGEETIQQELERGAGGDCSWQRDRAKAVRTVQLC